MTNEQNTKCHAIIHTASAAAGACGLSPIPGSDAIPIMAIQVTMIISLGEVFGHHFTRSYIEALAKNKIAEAAGKFLVGNVSRIIPGFGSIVNSGIAATVTEAIGWECAEEFDMRAA